MPALELVPAAQKTWPHAAELPGIHAPLLLLWGDTDPISPVAVGERLAA